MDPVGLGKDVLVCSSQRSGIDAVHVSSMKSSMKFEFLAFEVVYILVPTMAMDDWLRVSEVVWLAGAQESLWFDVWHCILLGQYSLHCVISIVGWCIVSVVVA